MMKTFAVGDIHGRFDCLQEVIDRIEHLAESARIIFLGDYIDRGPQSREVLERLMAGPTRPDDEWICLKGNHEDLMVNGPYDVWIGNGGYQTKKSFPGEIIPQAVLEWCRTLPIFWESEFHYFVHAGIMPGVPLGEQIEAHQLWIRGPFLNCDDEHPKHIVHGHTITGTYFESAHYVSGDQLKPVLRSNRTNLDTGAFYTNRISFAEFDLSRPGKPIRVETLSVYG